MPQFGNARVGDQGVLKGESLEFMQPRTSEACSGQCGASGNFESIQHGRACQVRHDMMNTRDRDSSVVQVSRPGAASPDTTETGRADNRHDR